MAVASLNVVEPNATRSAGAIKTVGPPKAEKPTFLLLACLLSGATLGLSAPGFGQWYLAWFALAPLFLFIYTSKTVWQATIRGACFGLGYHLVFLAWYTGLHPLTWMGTSTALSMFLTAACYLFETLHHTILVLVFAGIARALPMTGSFLPSRAGKVLHLPAFLVLPLLWVLCNNKVGNAYDLLGVPWAMLEYTQYCQLPIIQIASLVGGVGLEFIIVLVNVVLASVIATFWGRIAAKSLAAKSDRAAWRHAGIVAVGLLCMYAGGVVCLATTKLSPDVAVSCLQSARGKEKKRVDFDDQIQASKLSLRCTPGLCLWPTVPGNFNDSQALISAFSQIAKEHQLDIIVGGVATGSEGGSSHSMYLFDRHGTMGKDVYHKRYLVPFGEYTPSLVKQIPWVGPIARMLSDHRDFEAGRDPTLLSVDAGKVAPLVCFEVISPETAASSVRNGGQLLVDVGDRTWFRGVFGWMMGEQMLSMAVMRAVENRRYFAYLVKSGPSVLIEPTGRIAARAPYNQTTLLTGQVQFLSQPTLFTQLQTIFQKPM